MGAVNVMLVGIFDLSRFFVIHGIVAFGGFASAVIFGLLSHLLYKKEALAPYNDPNMSFWRKVLIWIAGIACIMMPVAHGSFAIREGDAEKLIKERVETSDTFGYFVSILFLVSELSLLITGAILVGIVIPRSLRLEPVEYKSKPILPQDDDEEKTPEV